MLIFLSLFICLFWIDRMMMSIIGQKVSSWFIPSYFCCINLMKYFQFSTMRILIWSLLCPFSTFGWHIQGKGPLVQRKPLKQRDYEIDLESRLGKTQVGSLFPRIWQNIQHFVIFECILKAIISCSLFCRLWLQLLHLANRFVLDLILTYI